MKHRGNDRLHQVDRSPGLQKSRDEIKNLNKNEVKDEVNIVAGF